MVKVKKYLGLFIYAGNIQGHHHTAIILEMYKSQHTPNMSISIILMVGALYILENNINTVFVDNLPNKEDFVLLFINKGMTKIQQIEVSETVLI